MLLLHPPFAESQSPITPLNHRAIDAEYSKQLDRIVTVSTTPQNQLHIVNPLTGGSVSVDLPLAPTCVSVGPDGLFAAVGHNGWISYVNLSTPLLLQSLPVTADVLDIILAGNGWVYAFPRRDQWTRIKCVNLESGKETSSVGNSIYAGTVARLHPSGAAMYGVISDIEKYDISEGTAVVLYDSPYHGDYEMCGNLWISEDGSRVFTRCGNVFRSSEIPTEDISYNGSLTDIRQIGDLSHSAAANKVLAIPGNIYGQPAIRDTEVWIYDYSFLSLESKIKLPPFSVNGRSYLSHGRFVFFNADGSRYSVIIQADTSSGLSLDYGIVTVAPGSGQFVIRAAFALGGSITPSGDVPVAEGTSVAFSILPDSGYDVADVIVDGVSVGKITSYSFEDVVANHRIEVSFTPVSGTLIAFLNHRVIDAEYSTPLDRIVTVTSTPRNQLHVVDPLTGGSLAVDLPHPPTCVSVGPDGLFAAVGHNGWISYVELSTALLLKTLPVTTDVLDIVLAGNGWVYAFPRRDLWATIRSINLDSGEEVQSGGYGIHEGTLVRLHPGGNAMYGADNGLTPSDIEKYDISQGAATVLYDSPYHGDYGMCGNLWISEDGGRIFTKCGNVFRSSEIRAEDMVYSGSLGSIRSIANLSHSTRADKVVAIPGNVYGEPATRDTEVWKYDYEMLSLESKQKLPAFSVKGQTYPGHGKFVFFGADGSRYSVILQADSSSGMLLDNGILTLGTDLNQFFIQATAGPGGTISPSGAVAVYEGNDQIFLITPSTGYHLSDVVVDDSSVGLATAYEFTNVTANHNIVANFALNRYSLTVTVAGATPGTIISYPTGITCGEDCTADFDYNTIVTLHAMSSTGNLSVSWSGDPDCSDGQVTMNADNACTAVLYPWGHSPFVDVPFGHWAWSMIVALSNAGITGGCSGDPPLFCPDDVLTRAQMAVFIETSLGAGLDSLPQCNGTVFRDVNSTAVGEPLCRFIEDFAARGITGGCSANPPLFCPDAPVTRQQMAVFLEAALGRIPAQLPPACSGTFFDLDIGTVEEEFLCRIIEDFAAQGITGGCGSGVFCPNHPVTRAQMAVFLVAAPDPLWP